VLYVSIGGVVGRFVPVVMVMERADATCHWSFSNIKVDSFSHEAWVKTNQKDAIQ
jgi:hypothetical protein